MNQTTWYLVALVIGASLVHWLLRHIEVESMVRHTMDKVLEGEEKGFTLDHVNFGLAEIDIVFEGGSALHTPFKGSRRERSAISRRDPYDVYARRLLKRLGKPGFGYFHYVDREGYFCSYICPETVLPMRRYKLEKETAAEE